MKIFISQPMNGRNDEEVLNERIKAIAFINTEYPGAEIIDSWIKENPDSGNIPVKYLADADLAIFLPRWAYARGCVIEELIARKYGIKTRYVMKGELQYDTN